jgi:hypothetical protein
MRAKEVTSFRDKASAASTLDIMLDTPEFLLQTSPEANFLFSIRPSSLFSLSNAAHAFNLGLPDECFLQFSLFAPERTPIRAVPQLVPCGCNLGCAKGRLAPGG